MWKESAAAHFEIEFTTDTQNGIADRFSFQAPKALPPNQIIARIDFLRPGIVRARGHSVGIRQQDELVHFLQRPPRTDKLRRQPIKQSGIGRWCPRPAEVARGLHDSLAEMVLPQAIYIHTPGQRILWADHPFCESQSAASG